MEDQISLLGVSKPATKKRNNNKLDTRGCCCFLCLRIVDFKTEDEEEDDERETIRNSENHSISLKSLRRYLKIDIDKLPGGSLLLSSSEIVGEHSSSPSSSLRKEEDIQVDLCESCANILNKFSSAFSTLEMIQVEVNYWLGRIHQQMPPNNGPSASSESDELLQSYKRRSKMPPNTTKKGSKKASSTFADALRKEIGMKCSKLRTNLEAKVELSRTKVQKAKAIPSSSSSTIFVLVEKPSTSTPRRTKDQVRSQNQSERSEDDSKFEFEDLKYSPPLSEDASMDDEEKEFEINQQTAEDEDPSSPEVKPSTSTSQPDDIIPEQSLKEKKTSNKNPPLYYFNSATKKFICNICQTKTTTKRNVLRHHENIHLKIKRAQCERCGNRYQSKAFLKRHLETCNGQIPEKKYTFNPATESYHCTLCSKSFFGKRSQGSAAFHYVSVHSNKTYKCEICSATFWQRSHLQRHQKFCRDTQDKIKFRENDPKYKWACSFCAKKFKQRNVRRDHEQQVHRKERNYSCDLCEKSFASAQYVKEHKISVHFGTRANCKFCSKSLKFGKSLRKHERECGRKKAEVDITKCNSL